MTHKFKIGDLVRCRSIPEFQAGEITCDKREYKTINGNISRVYDVKVGYEIKVMIEEGLEKIEDQSLPHTKYKIGDRVIFYFTDDEVMIGYIEGIRRQEENYSYTIISGNSTFLINEKYIIEKSEIDSEPEEENPVEEFKEGGEVWVKGNIIRWDNGDILCSSGLKIHIPHEGIMWNPVYLNKNNVFKSIPPKNEWISVKEKWPSHNQRVHFIYILDEEENAKITHTGFYDAKWKQFNLPYHNLEREKVTHWKPLDAAPEE